MLHNRLLGAFIAKYFVGVAIVLVGAIPTFSMPTWLLITGAGVAMLSGFCALWLRIGNIERARLEGYRAARADERRATEPGVTDNVRSLR